MSTRQKRNRWWGGLIVPTICLALLFYFSYHAQTGRYSIYTQKEMGEQALRLEKRLSDLREERRKLEMRVRQLTVGMLEKDALDEVARSQLGYIGDNEMVVFY